MTIRSIATTVAIAAVSLGGIACSSQFGEEEKVGCLPVTTTVLGVDDPSPLGFSGRAVLGAVGVDHRGTLTYADGTTTPLTIDVDYDGGEVRFHDNEWIDDGGTDIAPATGCLDTLEVDARVSFATMDGAFAEAWVIPLVASDAARATFGHEVGSAAGTFDPGAHVPPGETYDEVTAWVSGSFDATGARGEVVGQGERTDGDVASATRIDMATFETTPTSEAGAGCLPATTSSLGRSEASPLGFSADDVLSWAEIPYSFELVYADGTRTAATFSLTYDGGAIEHRDNEWMSTGGGAEPAPALGCADDLRIEVTVAFQTADGAFSESWPSAILATDASSVSFFRELESTTGTFDASRYAPAGHAYDAVRAFLDVTLESGRITGTVSGQGEGTSGTGPDGTAFAEMFPIASW